MLLLFLVLVAQVPSQGLVFENSSRAHFSHGPEGVTLRAGPGWLRLPNVMLDYELTFEYRLGESNADAGVVVRSWTKSRSWPNGGYRVQLPKPEADSRKALLIGRSASVETVRPSAPMASAPPDGWRRIHIKAERQRISITVDGVDGGEYRIDSIGGRVLFDVRKGAAELRNISVKDQESIASSQGPATQIDKVTDPGVTMPEVISEVKPQYTSDALRRRVEGPVEVQAVVLADGTVGESRVIRSLDPDLDRAALIAVRQWRFRPATRSGKTVPVLVVIEISFTLGRK